MLKGKRIIVTSGGTREYIDEVRVLTNISKGTLGSLIADTLIEQGAGVLYVHAPNAVMPKGDVTPYEVGSTDDLLRTLKTFMHDQKPELQPDAVIHCMAVSDFTFIRTEAVKCKSDSAEDFIEYMRKTITRNPKVISYIKMWSPKTVLVGFKFEVGASFNDLYNLAQKSIEKNGCDFVVTNDKMEMMAQGTHIAHFFMSQKFSEKGLSNSTVRGKPNIALRIAEILDEVL